MKQTDAVRKAALNGLIVRTDHLACLLCGAIEPVYPGHGTPASTFIAALILAAERHAYCSRARRQARRGKVRHRRG